MNVRVLLRTSALLVAVGLIAVGIFQPIEAEGRWLLFLWAAAPLLGVAAWLTVPPTVPSLARNVGNIGLVILIGFALLSLQLLRQQVLYADTIYHHVAVAADGSTTSNVRPVINSQRILRGRMFDRKGTLLADRTSVQGFAHRTYPIAERYDPAIFGHVLGFFSTRYGQSGLESFYNTYLTGERGNELERLRERLVGGTPQGNDLTLTLNADLQAAASAALGGRVGSVVVLDPRTGAILALVSQPSFDPRGLTFNPAAASWEAENLRVSQYWQQLIADGSQQPLVNRATQGLYPPGSTFKSLTAIAALEYAAEGQPDTITCPNTFLPQPDAPPIVNAVPNLAGLTGDPSDLERVFAYSCNTAFAQYALRLGPERMSEIARRFDILPPQRGTTNYAGFRELPTAQSLLYVEPGFLNMPRALADTGYGQGQLLVTPLHMALLTAAIGNEGVMMQPYLVQRITRPDGGQITSHVPRPIRRTMDTNTARIMVQHMGAVAAYGFGSSVDNFTPAGVTVGGKSGTAEHVPGARPHAWFIALAPLEAPRFAVAVMVESGGEGSSVGAELAGRVLGAAFATE
ncbi:peptidoglycan D,D-transpeptidase FtsI family protein [Candidatus Viridilinea mediisalina]|uniref:Peptidoglycan glycosyltransferase n=1 Tax=Candidatus Viridilinea mediisalina TaxID=2024553 RepID=A0A2A6RGS1_9CHLR|nr:penicillin-binding transpeptidase domain-containing protein [Candidatus Viridilinea mediisalina]PDW02078.1 peptidoglycan glycosyltransferase [Candidatus Viridilinea mediisalina]